MKKKTPYRQDTVKLKPEYYQPEGQKNMEMDIVDSLFGHINGEGVDVCYTGRNDVMFRINRKPSSLSGYARDFARSIANLARRDADKKCDFPLLVSFQKGTATLSLLEGEKWSDCVYEKILEMIKSQNQDKI